MEKPLPASDSKPINEFYLKPMIGNELLEKSEYDIEILKWVDGSTKDNKINKMILRPVEAGNMVELCRGKDVQLMITPGTLDTFKVLKGTKKSFMRKKEDLVLELLFYGNQQQKQQQNLSSVLINVEDRHVPEIKQYVQGIMEIEGKNYINLDSEDF